VGGVIQAEKRRAGVVINNVAKMGEAVSRRAA